LSKEKKKHKNKVKEKNIVKSSEPKPVMDKKIKRNRLPPALVLPVPKNRRDSFQLHPDSFADVTQTELTTIPTELPEVELDIFIPTHIVTRRPATQMHYAKLVRFVRTLRSAGRSIPFLLRNIVLELEDEQ